MSSRADAIAWAASVVADPATLYLDTETTGFGPDAEIVQVALLDWRGAPILDLLVRPTKPIPPDATAVHGISDADVADRPPWLDAGKLVNSYLREASRVVAYNAPYDLGVVRNESARAGFRTEHLTENRWHCAMRAFADFRGERRRGGRWTKLADAAAYFGFTIDAHDAAGDAYAAWLVVAGMATGQPEPGEKP